MSGLRRAFGHPDRTNDPHARARRLVSDRLLAPLAGPDESWLVAHLDGCEPCRRLAADWAADRDALRALGASAPVVPRDLGARLAAALDAEEARAHRSGHPGRAPVPRPARRASRGPAMAMALVAVVAALALVILPVVGPFAGGPFGPAATPIAVADAAVAWAHADADGRYVVQAAVVNRVCPGTETEVCGRLDEGAQSLVTLDMEPTQVILPPTGDQAIAVGPTGVYTFVVPEPGERVTPGPPTSSQQPTDALPTPAATEVPASPPAGTPAPSVPSSPVRPSPPPSPVASVATLPPSTPAPVAATALAILDGVVLVGAAPAYSADGRWLAFSARPVDGDRGPDVYVWRVGDERARRLTSTGSAVYSGWLGERILASSVDVVASSASAPESSPSPGAEGGAAPSGEPVTIEPAESPLPGKAPAATAPAAVASPEEPTAAPSPDVDGELAEAPTESPVAADSPAPTGTVAPSEAPSPTGTAAPSEPPAPAETPAGSVPPAGPSAPAPPSSGPAASPAPRTVALSFLLDPASGQLEVLARPGIWRPVVDPSGTTVVFFTGRFAWSDEERTWLPASGSLVVADWADVLDPERPFASKALPGAAGDPGTMRDWNVRWSDTGDHLAVWLADGETPSTGRLSLYAADDDGRPTETLLDGTAALPAFSIDARRLVWATPPGAGGEGNRVGVIAWGGAEPGAVFSAPQPGQGIVVVR